MPSAKPAPVWCWTGEVSALTLSRKKLSENIHQGHLKKSPPIFEMWETKQWEFLGFANGCENRKKLCFFGFGLRTQTQRTHWGPQWFTDASVKTVWSLTPLLFPCLPLCLLTAANSSRTVPEKEVPYSMPLIGGTVPLQLHLYVTLETRD